MPTPIAPPRGIDSIAYDPALPALVLTVVRPPDGPLEGFAC